MARGRLDREQARQHIGGFWDTIGDLQLDFLISHGLLPEHRLLDVGCGALRGGVRFIGYLHPNRYFGIDLDPAILDAGRRELSTAGLAGRGAMLRATDTFDVDFGVCFDVAIAQSVFSHLPLNSIQHCLINVEPVLADNGRFYATYFPAPRGKNDASPAVHPVSIDTEPTTTYIDRDPYHYDMSAFEWAVEGTGLRVRNLGEWGHPRGQHMLVFERI